MKKNLLLAMILILGVSAFAQIRQYANPKHLKNQSVPAVAIDNQTAPFQSVNNFVQSKSTLEETIGETRYDLQTNGAIQNRLYLWPDGTISAAWTQAQTDAGWPDRGTGYNYFSSSWGPAPTERIESLRSGWPSIAPWNGTGEVVVSHQSATAPLLMNTRPTKGIGSWTQSTIAAPAPATGLLWARLISSGPTNNYLHMIVVTSPTANGGVEYKGIDGALLYYRSLDGGATWDKNGVQLPGLDSTNYDAFGGDEYAWGTPHGDTIYFAVAGQWTDAFIMKSTDNGQTWTKFTALTNANKKLAAGVTEVMPFSSADGACAVEMDRSGIIHMSFGVGGGYASGGTKYIYVNRNGLVYWNTTMPIVKDSLDLDTLDAHGQLLGYVFDGPNPGDTIIAAPSYRVGLSSFPQITVDQYNNLYFLWDAVTPGNPSTDPYNYRHMWGRAKFHDKAVMTDMIDLNADVFSMFSEFAFPCMAKSLKNNNLLVTYQTSPQPGSALNVTTISIHDNSINYREIPLSTFWPVGVNDKTNSTRNVVSQNYPNPVKSLTYFNVKLEKAANVTVEVSNVMGQKIMTMDKGVVNAGSQVYSIDASQLSKGIYFYTVKINGQSYTHKMIVE